jgi:hypothetical protein
VVPTLYLMCESLGDISDLTIALIMTLLYFGKIYITFILPF